jgi:hypothetical protein
MAIPAPSTGKIKFKSQNLTQVLKIPRYKNNFQIIIEKACTLKNIIQIPVTVALLN